MYILENKNQPTPIEETTFADLNMLERDIEEMLRLNIDMLCENVTAHPEMAFHRNLC